MFDIRDMAQDFGTLGISERAARTPGQEIFGYVSARDINPDIWRGEYPNPAFGRMRDHDGAWAARIIVRFTPAHIAAAVRVGDFTNRTHATFLTKALVDR